MLRNVRIGFSKFGFMVAALQLLPNVFWVLFPPAQNVLTANSSTVPVLEYGEHILGISIVIFLVFLVPRQEGAPVFGRFTAKLSLAAIALCWLGWVLYYIGIEHNALIYAMVVLPPIAFFLAGLAQRIRLISVLSLVFLVFHFAVTLENFPLW